MAPDPANPGRRQPPMTPARPRKRRPRGLILLLLVAATIGGVVAAMPHHGSFDVTTVRTGDFVKVDDDSGHITGKLPGSKARNSADGRRVTAKEDGADPAVCEKFRVLGRPDVERSVSFCLVRPVEEPAAPAR